MKRKSFLTFASLLMSVVFSIAATVQAAEYCVKTTTWGNATFMDCYAQTPSGSYIKVGDGMAYGRDVTLSNGNTSARITAYSYGGMVYAQGLDMFMREIPGCVAKATSINRTVTDASGCGSAYFVRLKILKQL